MSCITVFGKNEQDEKSILKKKLISHFKRDGKKNLEESKKLADYVYNDIIATPSSIETSFNSYILGKKDFETYTTGEPTIEEFFEWREHVNFQNKMKKVFSTNDFMSTQREFIDLADGFTAYLFETLYDKGFTPNDLFEEGAINIRENNILNITLNKVLDELREEITYLEDDVSIARIADMIDAIETNKVDFLNTYNNYLDSTFGFKINAKSVQEQEDMDTDEAKETKDLAYNRVAHEFDQKDGASKAIKMLIAGLYIPAENDSIHVNDLGLMDTTNYAETFNFIHQVLMDIPPSIENYINVLKDNVHRKPELQVLINRLNFSEDGNYVMSSDPDVAAREQLLRTQFVNQFDKSNMEFTIHIKREDGTISAINANMDKVEDVLLSDWANNFQQNIQNNPNIIDDIFEAAGSDKLKFFQLLGLNITDASIIPDSVHSNIYNFGIKNKTEQEIFDIYKPKGNEGIKSQLRYIANKVALQSPDVIDFQHYSSEGKLIYGITLNTHLSSMVKNLAYYAGQENKIAELYPQLFDSPYTFDSIWTRKIVEGDKIKMGVYDGFKNLADGRASSTKELKAKDLNVQRVVGMLMEGKYPFLRSADRGTENYFVFENITRPIIGGTTDAKIELLRHLESEIMTMQSTVDVAHFEKNNSDFRVFHVERNGKKVSLLEEFNPEIRKIITKIENENKKSKPSKIILRELENTLLEERKNALDSISSINVKNNGKVIGFIDELMESVIKKEEAFLTASGVLDTDINGNYKHLSEVVKEYKGINAVIEVFALNSFIANIEQTKLFVGDPAFYKNASDIFKRMSMFNSTKESARIDQEMLTYLSTLTNEFEAKHGYKIPRNNNTIRTISMRDVESTANEFSEEFHNMLIEMFEENSDMYMDAYNKMNEADGFAFMTLDEYRIALNRYGQWFPPMEATYQKILNDPTNVSSRDIMNFTPLKLQYTGRLTNIKGMDVPAGRKFAVIPLVPTMIGDNTTLAKLNEQMLSNGVGMAFFESAAKFGHGELYEMYDENRNFNIELNQDSYFDEIDYRYMGNQLKINNEAKKDITASTQKRKNMLVNIFNNGKIDLSRLSERQIEILMEEYDDTDIESILEKESEKMGALVDEYDRLQSLIVEEGYKKATDGLGKEGNLKEKSALNRFIDGLLQQGLRQGYTVGELSSLHELKETPILEILGNKQKIENLIMAKLSRNAISNKRGGDSLAQIPDVGFEITDRVEEESSRHNLKFYERSKDGKKLLPMEIMVALPKEMESYVAYNYGNKDGNLTSDKLDAFNDAIAEDDKRFREKGEHSELSRMITYIGFRIPNQGASSSDVAKVKKFFPPYMHGSVAVPKPIVAKTGSDFDIDKMNFYKPHFRQVRENERGHAETFADTFLSKGGNSFETVKNIMVAGFGVNPDYYKTHNVARGAFISRVLLSNEPSDLPGIQQIRDEFQNYLNSNRSKVTALEYIQGGTENKMQIDNRLIEIEEQLTLHMANERQLLTPLTDSRIKSIVELIRRLRGEPVVQEDHISDIFTNKTNVEKFISFLSGLGGVGQTAVHIPNHAMAQKAGLKMLALHNYFGMGKPSNTVQDLSGNTYSVNESDIITYETESGPIRYITDENGDMVMISNKNIDTNTWIDMGNIDSIDGVNISEILSEIITSFVDVAKDPYILDINAVQSTTNTIMMMIRQGMPLETVFLFMNQPIIRDYVRQQQLNESVVSGEDALEKAQLVSKVLSEFGENPNVSDMIYRTEEQIADGKDIERKPKIYNDIDVNNLKDNIRKGKRATNQKQMLDLFLEYQRQSRIFGAMVRSTSPDTKGFKNLNTLMTQLQERIDVEESGMFQNFDKMFEGFVGTYHDAKESYQNLVKDMFLLQQEAIVGEINKLKDTVITKFMDQDTKDRILTLIDNEAVSHMLAVTGQINYKEDFRRLFTGPRSIPKVVKEIQEFIKGQGLKNAFFDNMLPLINETREGYDSMKPKTKKLTTTQKERMAVELSDFIDYYESNGLAERFGIEDFRNDILKYQMIQSGIKNSPYSFMEMMDPSDYHNMSKVAVNLTKDDIVKWLDFTNTDPEYQPSTFIMHHLNEFYKRSKRKDFPWRIGYDVDKKLFYAVMQPDGGGIINLQQVGRGVRFMMYGTIPLHFHGRVGQSLDTELGNNNC